MLSSIKKLIILYEKYTFIFFLTSVFFVSHGLFFFTLDARYWDDWNVWGTTDTGIKKMALQMGQPWHGYLVLAFGSDSTNIWRATSLISQLLSGIFFYLILKKINFFTNKDIVLISALFIVMPVNSTQNVASVQHYQIYLFLFLFAYAILIHYYKSSFAILLSSFLFLLSFTTSSLLVFFLLPIVHLMYLLLRVEHLTIKHITKRYFILFLLPFAYFILQEQFYSPFGIYKNYNSFSLKDLLFGVVITIFPLFLLLMIFIKNLMINRSFNSYSRFMIFSLIGLFILNLGTLPYLAVVRYMPYEYFGHRHELLWPFGLSLIVYALLQFISYNFTTLGQIVSYLLLVVFTVIHIEWGIEYIEAAEKHERIFGQIKNNSEFYTNKLIILEDLDPTCNLYGKPFNFVHYSGMFRHALDSPNQLALPLGQVPAFESGTYDEVIGPNAVLDYNAGGYKKEFPVINVTFDLCGDPVEWYWVSEIS